MNAAPNRKQRGVAIILAMGVVALAAMAATAVMVAHSAWARQVELARDHAQARALADAGIDWARAVLHDDRRLGAVDHPGEPWALRLPPMPVENGELTGHIEDQQGLFNLNNLVRDGKTDAVQLAAFRRLLVLLDLPEELAAALADWLDADDIAQPQGGAEDAHYLALQPPHRAANRALLDIAELAQVRGFTLEARVRLRPFVAALPRATPLNVNSAPPEVLAAVLEGLDIDGARDLAAQRARAYFKDSADFLGRLPQKVSASSAGISVGSDFFLASVRVGTGSARARGAALLERHAIGWPVIVWYKAL